MFGTAKRLPPLPPADVWAAYTPEQREAFWAECRAVTRSARGFLLIWQVLFVATIMAGIVAALVMGHAMLPLLISR